MKQLLIALLISIPSMSYAGRVSIGPGLGGGYIRVYGLPKSNGFETQDGIKDILSKTLLRLSYLTKHFEYGIKAGAIGSSPAITIFTNYRLFPNKRNQLYAGLSTGATEIVYADDIRTYNETYGDGYFAGILLGGHMRINNFIYFNPEFGYSSGSIKALHSPYSRIPQAVVPPSYYVNHHFTEFHFTIGVNFLIGRQKKAGT